MTDEEFSRQYAEAGGEGFRVDDSLICRRWAEGLSGWELTDALRERVYEAGAVDSEMEALLCEIAGRLGEDDAD